MRGPIIGLIASLFIVFGLLVTGYFCWHSKLKNSPEVILGITRQSEANITLEGQDLDLTFNILPQDQQMANEFSQSLGVDNSWEQGIKVVISSQAEDFIKNYLPLKVNLNFTAKRLQFSSEPNNASLTEPNLIPATSSAGVKLGELTDSGYQVEIDDPSLVFNQAAERGQIRISPKAAAIWQLLAKLAKITVKLRPHSLIGEIDLN